MQTDRFYTDSTDGHVSLERLRRYQAGALPATEQHRVEKHLLDCQMCADVLDGLAASPEPVTQRAVQDINRRLATTLAHKRKVVPFYAQTKNWGVAAALVLFILAGAAVVYYNLQNITPVNQKLGSAPTNALPGTNPVIKPAPSSTLEKKELAFKPDSLANKYAQHTPQPISAPGPRLKLPTTNAVKTQKAVPLIDSIEIAIPEQKMVVTQAPTAIMPDTIAQTATDLPNKLAGRVAGVQVNKAKVAARGESVLAIRGSANIAARVVTGKVSDNTGEALPGVTVSMQGTSVGAVTNERGEYSIHLPAGSNEATLVFSFIGYATTEKKITNLGAPLALNVEMAANTHALSEVVVVGYGTQNKNAVTGAIAYAKPKNGFRAFRKYIQQNLKYPEAAKTKKVKGRVVVGFTVNPNGERTNFTIIKSLDPACDAEALRLVKEGPAWEPTQQAGQKISQTVRVSIRFKPTP